MPLTAYKNGVGRRNGVLPTWSELGAIVRSDMKPKKPA